jgi:hypothetical protein
MKSILDGQDKNKTTASGRLLLADLGKTKESSWGKSVPLELLLAVGTILYHVKALKR